jgi:proton-dependent oligopeptide transporter, POT family
LACASFLLVGSSASCFLVAGAIAVFSAGEMLSSPKFSEFMGNLAPADKKAMYLGFSQLPLAVGMSLEGWLGPVLYERLASKEAFAREALAQGGMAVADVARIPQGEAFGKLVDVTGQTKDALTASLYASHSVGRFWYLMATVGVVTAFAIVLYARALGARSRRLVAPA